MQLSTIVSIPKSPIRLSYQSRLMFVGSCFAENISAFFRNAKFRCLVNPSGIVYNPLSLSNMFTRLISGYRYSESDFFENAEQYCCYDLHGSFSRPDICEAIENANRSMDNAREFLRNCDVLFITLGTAFVYFLGSDAYAVSNCHKMPADTFTRRLVSVDELTASLMRIVQGISSINENMRIVFTVSPIRHLKDGAHGNSLSKSSLFLAVNNLVENCTNCEYFPSYEILEDELRDYRFYAEDLVHPSTLSEKIIWQRIRETYFDDTVDKNVSRVEKFMASVNHRIQNPDSNATQIFCQKNLSLAYELEEQIPGLDLSDEKNYYKNFVKFC